MWAVCGRQQWHTEVEMWGQNEDFDYEGDFDSGSISTIPTVQKSIQKSSQNVQVINNVKIDVSIIGREITTAQTSSTLGAEIIDTVTETVIKSISKEEGDIGKRLILKNVTEVIEESLSTKEGEESETGDAGTIVVWVAAGILICVIIVTGYLCYRNRARFRAGIKSDRSKGGYCWRMWSWFKDVCGGYSNDGTKKIASDGYLVPNKVVVTGPVMAEENSPNSVENISDNLEVRNGIENGNYGCEDYESVYEMMEVNNLGDGRHIECDIPASEIVEKNLSSARFGVVTSTPAYTDISGFKDSRKINELNRHSYVNIPQAAQQLTGEEEVKEMEEEQGAGVEEELVASHQDGAEVNGTKGEAGASNNVVNRITSEDEFGDGVREAIKLVDAQRKEGDERLELVLASIEEKMRDEEAESTDILKNIRRLFPDPPRQSERLVKKKDLKDSTK